MRVRKRLAGGSVGTIGETLTGAAAMLEAKRNGWMVCYAVAKRYGPLLRNMGFSADELVLYDCPLGRIFDQRRDLLVENNVREIVKLLSGDAPIIMGAFRQAVERINADAFLFSEFGAADMGWSLMDLFPHLKGIIGFIMPKVPTGAVPSSLLGLPLWLPAPLNYITHNAPNIGNHYFFTDDVNAVRRAWGLRNRRWPVSFMGFRLPWEEPQYEGRTLVLHSFSDHLIGGLGERYLTTGSWLHTHDEDYELSVWLKEFIALNEGKPIVLLDMGSIPVPNPHEFFQMVCEVCHRLGIALIVAAGDAGLGEGVVNTDNLFILREHVPHSVFLQYVDVIIHKCGAGITHRACAMGVVSVGVPVLYDQFMWMRVLKRAGVLAGGASFTKLTADVLEAAIKRALEDEELKLRVKLLGAKMSQEDGSANAFVAMEAFCQAA